MTQMPSLTSPQRKRPLTGILALVLVAALLAGGFVLYRSRRNHTVASAPVDAGTLVVVAPPPPPTVTDQLAKAGLKHAHVNIQGPLETSIIDAAGPQVGPSLTQVVTRDLVWWIEVPGDLRKGDSLDILYEERANQEPIVHAVRFVSSKIDKTLAAYRYKAPADTFARLYQASAEELELRLKDAPLDDYEQVTSHLRDGRHHKGVDFKTPMGSKVHATFAGTITRKTWAFRGNGNSLEIADGTGRHAMFLHLSELPKTTHPGQRVAKGEIIAESGNTGHSFAPHLHYQLMNGEKLLDPFKVQETYRRSLAADQRSGFDAEVHRLDALMGASKPAASGTGGSAPTQDAGAP